MPTQHQDPEYQRWRRKYPRFPGVAKCVELLRSTNVRGAWVDIICFELENHASDNAADLIAATRLEVERNSQVGRILLHVLADSKLLEAYDFFAELINSPDETIHPYAISGLKILDTKESRRLLHEHNRS